MIKNANKLFSKLAPETTTINNWYLSITDDATSKEFDFDTSNQNWFGETLPITQGFWHAKYFLEQMLFAADELNEAPKSLPSRWAAVLYLYNLR